MHKLKQNKQKFSEITEKLNIDESQTKTRHKPKQYNMFFLKDCLNLQQV